MSMKEFNKRLLFLWNNAPITQIAADLSWSPTGISRLLKRNVIPKADTLMKIQKLKGCDWQWLITGDGVPFPEPAAAIADAKLMHETKIVYSDQLPLPDSDQFIFVAHHALTDLAADHTTETPKLMIAFRHDWFKHQIQTDSTKLSIITIKGDAMKGVLDDGDQVLIDHNQNQPGDGLYALKIGQHLLVRHTQMMPDHQLWIKAVNPAYDPFKLNLHQPHDDLVIIGKVVWAGRKIY